MAIQEPAAAARCDDLGLARSLRVQMLRPQPSSSEDEAAVTEQQGAPDTSHGDALARSLRLQRMPVRRGPAQNPKSLLEQFKKRREPEVTQSQRRPITSKVVDCIKEEDEQEKEADGHQVVEEESTSADEDQAKRPEALEKEGTSAGEGKVNDVEVAKPPENLPTEKEKTTDEVTYADVAELPEKLVTETESTTDEESKNVAAESGEEIDKSSWLQGWLSWLCLGRGM
eukprot:TRINITY_DN7004_c0_g6_i2.p1 TRINITY_DN7004_c0_g6~~TRINITY_DN7004_c0_g6_i2.p1  ORF type:complete len:228 (-),score=58.09 TRINITY_DN7004_c0_g6_i2:183-866(-)